MDFTEIRHVSEDDFPRWTRRVNPETGDIVFTYEATLHRYGMIPDGFRGCLGRRVALIRPDVNKVDQRFLLYYFLSLAWRHVVESNVITGATVDRIPLERFPNFPISVPQLSVQRHLADILSAYDDLIENNRRRMALLEEAARQLYREWFVRFRFPGHEHTRIIDGVPDGWVREKVVSLLAKIESKNRIPKDDYLAEGPIPCVDQSADFIGGFTDDETAVYSEPLPVTVFGDHTRALKFVNFPFARGADGTQVIYPNTDRISSEYLYLSLKEIDLSNYFYARHFKFLKEKEVLLPKASLVRDFTAFARPCFKQIQTLRLQSQKLRAARDPLLPRLMSGKILI